MKPQELLAHIEPLNHDERVRYMHAFGKAATTDSQKQATVAELEKGDYYARYLALTAGWGAGDARFALHVLVNDTSRHLRGLALHNVLYFGTDAELLNVALEVNITTRRTLLGKLYGKRRFSLLDKIVEAVAARDEDELPTILHFATPPVIETHFDTFERTAGSSEWYNLARHYPQIAVAKLSEKIGVARTDITDWRLLLHINLVLQACAKVAPQAGIELAKTVLDNKLYAIQQLSISLLKLLQSDPNGVADLLLNLPDETPIGMISFGRVLHRLETSKVAALAQKRPQTVNSTHNFKKLPSSVRNALYEAFKLGWRDSEGTLNVEIVDGLPGVVREAEARRNLALPAQQTRPQTRLPYAAYLPWDEANTLLKAYVGDPDPELRKLALATLLNAGRYQRDRLPEILELVLYRKNEQDPIRQAMLRGLTNLPPGIWQAEHLEKAGQIIRQALDAADLSHATAALAELLIIKLLPRHTVWSAQWLTTIVKERGNVNFYSLENRLTNSDVQRIAPILLPVLQAWETRERESQILQAARSFGRRLEVWDEFVDLIERVVTNSVTTWNATSALSILQKYRPDRLAKLVPQLIQKDPSWVTQAPVYTYLHRRRQDLLTPFLGQTAYSGRFSSGNTHWILPLYKGFFRWTPNQQTIFTGVLSRFTGDEQRDSPALLSALEQLGAMPALPPSRLLQIADFRERPALRDKAIRVIGRFDDAAQIIPALLSYMGDDRARIAIYALRSTVLEISKLEALRILRNVPMNKVTVAKEVLRLIGDLRTPEARTLLLEFNGRELHRDVRVALLRGLWEFLEAPETWVAMENASRSPDPAVATIVGRIPADKLDPDARRRLLRLVAILMEHREPRVRLNALSRCVEMPLLDSERILQPNLVKLLASKLPDESRAAAGALFATYSSPADATLAAQAVAGILPNRKILQDTFRVLMSHLGSRRDKLLPVARAVLPVLRTDPLLLNYEVELALMVSASWQEVGAYLTELVTTRRQNLHPGAATYTVATVENIVRNWADTTQVAALELEFSQHADDLMRRLGLAMLTGLAAPPRGWNAPYRARLEAYRADPSPLVASAAQFIFPPDEAENGV
jgi:hypothetical protein